MESLNFELEHITTDNWKDTKNNLFFSATEDDGDNSADDIAEHDTNLGGEGSSAGVNAPHLDPQAILEMTQRLAPNILDPSASKGKGNP